MKYSCLKKAAMLCLATSQTLTFAFKPNPNGPFVQTHNQKKYLNPIFNKTVLEEMHALLDRSYELSARGQHKYDYLYPTLLESSVPWHFNNNSQREWFCHRPFIGTHGANSIDGLIGNFLPAKIEVDYAGFVALKHATETTPPILMIVFRGSQGNKRFEPLGGVAGPSWMTNINCGKMAFPNKFLGHDAVFHTGYLEKYLSLKYSLYGDIGEMVSLIPQEQRHRLVVVITGHSQGGGVVQPAALDVVTHWGPRIFGYGFSNTAKPRFFSYILSGPNVLGDDTTKEIYYRIVGKDNILRHASVFDIVTYACLGQKYENKFLLNLFLQSLLGIKTGFRHVGHLAIDDIRSLLAKGFKANGQLEYLKNIDNIANHLADGYEYYLKGQQKCLILRRVNTLFAAVCYQRAFNLMGGIGNFVAIQHYGSFQIRHRKDGEKLCYEYNPVMPSCFLNAALVRGEQHRLATMGIVPHTDAARILCSNPIVKKKAVKNPTISDISPELTKAMQALFAEPLPALAKN